MRPGDYNKRVEALTKWGITISTLVAGVLAILYFLGAEDLQQKLISAGLAVVLFGTSIYGLYGILSAPNPETERRYPTAPPKQQDTHPIVKGTPTPIRPRLPITITSRKGAERKT
jgi:ABC-type uncharacterized transport system permease subunit